MKTTLLLVLHFLTLLLAIPSNSNGAVVVYRRTDSAQYIGQGFNVRISITGYTVLDSQSVTGFHIAGFKINGQKYFTTAPFEVGTRSYSVTGSGGRDYSAFIGSGVTNTANHFEDGVDFSFGANATLTITPTNTVRLPRVIDSVGHGIAIPTGQSGIVAKSRGVASYSKTETRLANSLGETAGDSLARYRALFISRGYQDVTE